MSRALPTEPQDPAMGTIQTPSRKFYVKEKVGAKLPFQVIKGDTNAVVDAALTRAAANVKMNRLMNQ